MVTQPPGAEATADRFCFVIEEFCGSDGQVSCSMLQHTFCFLHYHIGSTLAFHPKLELRQQALKGVIVFVSVMSNHWQHNCGDNHIRTAANTLCFSNKVLHSLIGCCVFVRIIFCEGHCLYHEFCRRMTCGVTSAGG